MTVNELRDALLGYPGEMEVKLAVGNIVHPAKQVDVCVDMDSNTKSCVIYGIRQTWEDIYAAAKARLDNYWDDEEDVD